MKNVRILKFAIFAVAVRVVVSIGSGSGTCRPHIRLPDNRSSVYQRYEINGRFLNSKLIILIECDFHGNKNE